MGNFALFQRKNSGMTSDFAGWQSNGSRTRVLAVRNRLPIAWDKVHENGRSDHGH